MKDIHTYGEKMARNGRTKDIYKGTFVCIQTLLLWNKVKSRMEACYSELVLEVSKTNSVQCKDRI